MTTFRTGKDFAFQMDASDPLVSYRDKFLIPEQDNSKECTYFPGNSHSDITNYPFT